METLKSNNYIRDFLKSIPSEKQNSLLENILIIGIDFIKKIYDCSEIYNKVKTIASFKIEKLSKYLIFLDNIVNLKYSSNYLQDASLKEDIMKIQEEITKLNKKFDNEPLNSNAIKVSKSQNKKTKIPTEKKCKKSFKISNLAKTETQKRLLNHSITPKVIIFSKK